MSIQPNRVVARIIAQVDQADWPRLESRCHVDLEDEFWVRVYRAPAHARYATPIHFWVHALRDDLDAVGCRDDLVGAAGHLLARRRPAAEWFAEFRALSERGGVRAIDRLGLGELAGVEPAVQTSGPISGHALEPDGEDEEDAPQVHLMLESVCRRSSVWADETGFVADFWGHGGGPSWRQRIE